jgi:hypothetical protein
LATPLRGLANYQQTTSGETEEPENSYHGYRHAVRLLGHFDSVVFHNVVMRRIGPEIVLCESTMADWWRQAAQADLIVGYSLHGAAIAWAVRLINSRGAFLLITFSHPSPSAAWLRRTAKFAVNRLGEASATWIAHFSPSYAREVRESAFGSTLARRQGVAPVTVDVAYFAQKQSQGEGRLGLPAGRKYLLIVGDSTRDDDFMYEALQQVDLPVIRVTRDPMVEKRVALLLVSGRGDRLAVGIPFSELAGLYRGAVAAIYVSTADTWQPAGATSIGECLACACVAVAEGGGVIEFDYRFHAQVAPPLDCPIRFFGRRDAAGLVAALRTLEQLTESEAADARAESLAWARAKLNLDLSWGKLQPVIAATVSVECVY